MFWTLQRGEVAHIVEDNKFGCWNGLGQVFGVFALDEFVMLALCDYDRYADLREILRGIIGLRPLHKADMFNEVFELFWRG